MPKKPEMGNTYAELSKRLLKPAAEKSSNLAENRSIADAGDRQFLIGTLADPAGRKRWAEYKNQQAKIEMKGEDFTGYDLRDYDLRGVNLTQSIFLGCDLSGADFTEATLNYADLRKVNLRNACLKKTVLAMAILNDAKLVDALLADANLKGAHLAGADLTGADLTKADLTGADLRGATLKFAKLTGANLRGANLADANLTGIVAEDEALKQARNALRAVVDEHEYKPMPSLGFRQRGALTLRAEEEEDTEPRVAAKAGPEKTPPRAGGDGTGSGSRLREGKFEVPQWDVEPDLESMQGCYQVLEVSPNATAEEVVSAFRKKAKLYHPDMVRHLSPRLQELSSHEFQRLHKAYERLTRRTTRSIEGVVWAEGVPHRASAYDYTVEDYETLVRVNQNNFNIIYNLAWKYFEAERHVEALAYFTRVMELNPGDQDARYNATICRICLELLNATQAK